MVAMATSMQMIMRPTREAMTPPRMYAGMVPMEGVVVSVEISTDMCIFVGMNDSNFIVLMHIV